MKNSVKAALLMLSLSSFSCSDKLQRRYDERHGTYTSRGDSYSRDGRYGDNRSTTEPRATAYRPDYSKMAEDQANGISTSTGYGTSSGSQRMLGQYEEMDQLGEAVVDQLNVLDTRWESLLREYRSSNKSGKEVIASQLDRITSDQLTLHKAYIHIYHDGKANWPVVKREVESTLSSVKAANER